MYVQYELRVVAAAQWHEKLGRIEAKPHPGTPAAEIPSVAVTVKVPSLALASADSARLLLQPYFSRLLIIPHMLQKVKARRKIEQSQDGIYFPVVFSKKEKQCFCGTRQWYLPPWWWLWVGRNQRTSFRFEIYWSSPAFVKMHLLSFYPKTRKNFCSGENAFQNELKVLTR